MPRTNSHQQPADMYCDSDGDEVPMRELRPAEENALVWCMAKLRISPTRRNISEYANSILANVRRIPPGQTPPRIRERWIDSFLARNDAVLREIDRAPSRERITSWYDVLHTIEEKRHVKPRHHHCMDQITLPSSLSYQPKFPGDNGRESATLLVSVCAEGYSSMPPMVIFQSTDSSLGDHDWDNPLRASVFTSKIAVINRAFIYKWFKNFEKKTRPSGNEEGEYRQLSVRWHRSFINIKLLNYAVKHRVEIGAYGINTNHIVNPLDYACFAPFKARYDKARREYERGTGKRVDKATFLRIIAKPYLETFTIPLIQRAFRETGQWPVNPDIITPRLPIPSRDLGLFASDLHLAVFPEDEQSAGGEPAATPGTH